MKINKQARRDGKGLFRSCLTNGRLDESKVREVVRLVLDKRPRGWLAALSHFERLVRLEVERRRVRVETPTTLDASLQDRLKAVLENLYGEGLSYEVVQNAELLGGLKVRVGSDVYDGSIQARLAALEESF